jgi:hypothetical protein
MRHVQCPQVGIVPDERRSWGCSTVAGSEKGRMKASKQFSAPQGPASTQARAVRATVRKLHARSEARADERQDQLRLMRGSI